MAYKMSLMLSMVFLMFLFLTSTDLICVSQTNSNMNALAITVAYRVQKDGKITNETFALVDEYGCSMTYSAPSGNYLRVGDTFKFALHKAYRPLIMSKDPMVITVTHSCVVGFYDSYY